MGARWWLHVGPNVEARHELEYWSPLARWGRAVACLQYRIGLALMPAWARAVAVFTDVVAALDAAWPGWQEVLGDG